MEGWSEPLLTRPHLWGWEERPVSLRLGQGLVSDLRVSVCTRV